MDFTEMSEAIYKTAIAHGWWDKGPKRNKGEVIALIHSEVSELLDAVRMGNPPDEHCPEFSSAEIEAADILIRVLDMCRGFGWNIEGAVKAKMVFNANRPYKHGKSF